MALIVGLAALTLCACSSQEKTVPVKALGAQSSGGESANTDNTNSVVQLGPEGGDQSLRLQWDVAFDPQRPTAADAIKAVVKSKDGLPEGTVYKYRWDVNYRVVENVSDDTLPNKYFRKKDLVRVTVTAVSGKMDYFKSRSVYVAAAPPSVNINVLSSDRNGLVIMRIDGKDPGGGKLSYALEPPVVDGMKLNAEEGKIQFVIPKGAPGKIPFRISVSDAEGDKFIASFELTASDKPIVVSQPGN
jgi:hypothetical protein